MAKSIPVDILNEFQINVCDSVAVINVFCSLSLTQIYLDTPEKVDGNNGRFSLSCLYR